MSEKKQQNVFVPLRVRFRSPAEQAQSEHERPSSISPAHPLTTVDHSQDIYDGSSTQRNRISAAHTTDQGSNTSWQYLAC